MGRLSAAWLPYCHACLPDFALPENFSGTFFFFFLILPGQCCLDCFLSLSLSLML